MKTSQNTVSVIGYASGIGAGNTLCDQAVSQLNNSSHLSDLNLNWKAIIIPNGQSTGRDALPAIADMSDKLAHISLNLAHQRDFFVTLGGDHTSAIGTWSGVATAIAPESLGLIWIDAHLDSHTFETTPSGNIHGMPLAVLLGQGHHSLTQILTDSPKLLPQNVCVIGARSFEAGERKLLEALKVRIYYMEEIQERGLAEIFKEAVALVTTQANFFGISLDLDAIDPLQAPGVGTPEPNGLDSEALINAFAHLGEDPRFIAAEIVEFNPTLDKDHKTEKIVVAVLKQFTQNSGEESNASSIE
ncbi:MAG: arginase [Gammaproteobacteria bacterium]|nr:arginase [Gammaproteobacteria bacterium]